MSDTMLKEDNIPKPDLTVGGDSVLFKDGEVVIYSSYDMEDWKVTKYRKAAIFFKDKKYFLTRKSKLEDGTFRYKLKEWPEDHVDLPSKSIVYDEEYVAERDTIHIKVERIKKISLLMKIIYPLLGFLPSRLKERLQDKYGVDPVNTTGFSLFIEYLFAALVSCLYVIQLFTRGLPSWFDYSPTVVILVVLDAVIRWHDLLGEAASPYGFYEWIFKLRLK
jgi:hypothetical protein